MTQNDLKEHIAKEMLKEIVHSSPNYSARVKADLNALIDGSETPEKMCQAILIYFASHGQC